MRWIRLEMMMVDCETDNYSFSTYHVISSIISFVSHNLPSQPSSVSQLTISSSTISQLTISSSTISQLTISSINHLTTYHLIHHHLISFQTGVLQSMSFENYKKSVAPVPQSKKFIIWLMNELVDELVDDGRDG